MVTPLDTTPVTEAATVSVKSTSTMVSVPVAVKAPALVSVIPPASESVPAMKNSGASLVPVMVTETICSTKALRLSVKRTV